MNLRRAKTVLNPPFAPSRELIHACSIGTISGTAGIDTADEGDFRTGTWGHGYRGPFSLLANDHIFFKVVAEPYLNSENKRRLSFGITIYCGIYRWNADGETMQVDSICKKWTGREKREGERERERKYLQMWTVPCGSWASRTQAPNTISSIDDVRIQRFVEHDTSPFSWGRERPWNWHDRHISSIKKGLNFVGAIEWLVQMPRQC